MSVGGSLRVSFQPNSCSVNQTANAAMRSERRQRVSIFGDSVNRPFLALFIHSDRLPFEHRALRATEDIPVRLRLWWYLSRQFDFGILRHDWFPVRQDYPVLPQ
jgi:hypothetical protein